MSKSNFGSLSERYIEANGVNFHFWEAGQNHVPLLVFVHGFPCYGGMWESYLESFRQNYHVVALDLRGYNLSSSPKGKSSYLLHTLSDDLREFVFALGKKEAYLIAHDWGGLIAWDALSRFPEVFRKGVILNAPHPKIYARLYEQDADQQTKGAYTKLFCKFWAPYLLQWKDYRLLKAGVFKASRHHFSDREKEGYLNAWRRGLRFPLMYYRANLPEMLQFRSLQKIKVPVLVLWGELDQNLSIHNLDGLEEEVENLKIIRYPDATHWLPHEKVMQLSEEIQTFFKNPK